MTTAQKTTTLPFRADHVGSFLRTEPLKDARLKFAAGEIDAAVLDKVETEEITKLVQDQKDNGLQGFTDGEFRRSWWHIDFIENLNGFEGYVPEHGYDFGDVEVRKYAFRNVGKISFNPEHPFLAAFESLNEIVGDQGVVKFTIPSPNEVFYPGYRNEEIYPSVEAYQADVQQAYIDTVQAFYDLGCRYLQLDDVHWGFLCNLASDTEAYRADKRIAAENVQAIIDAKPADLVLTTHVCRGNYKSHHSLEGPYDPIAEELFGQTHFDGYFLEYDTDRSGGFEPLAYFKGHGRIVLGLVTSKTAELEDKEEIKARIKEASKYVPLDQLALSTQCGFASTEEGNLLTEAEQWAKVRHVVEIAKEVWPED